LKKKEGTPQGLLGTPQGLPRDNVEITGEVKVYYNVI